MSVRLLEYPGDADWQGVYQRAMVTVGSSSITVPPITWRTRMLAARHSPIRYLQFSFLLEDIPYWVSVHLCRHVHAQPYVRSQRNDRQTMYDRNAAPQSAPVSMIWDINAEELMVIANKRLCHKASAETRMIVQAMCEQVIRRCPEFDGLLIPMCEYQGGVCHEMKPCGRWGARLDEEAE